MTAFIKKFLAFIAVLALVALPLASCGEGIDRSDAKIFIGEFLEAIAEGDYERAEGYLHPERPTDLENFILCVEIEEDLDFSAGIDNVKYIGFSYSFYDSTVDGSRYEPTISASIGGEHVTFTVEVVQNENGYGIYNFNIDT